MKKLMTILLGIGLILGAGNMVTLGASSSDTTYDLPVLEHPVPRG